RAEGRVVAQETDEGRRELLQTVTVAAPVVRLLADDVLQRLREHRTLHRVPVLEAGVQARHVRAQVLAVVDDLHRAGRITEVPGEAIHARVDVTRSAGDQTRARSRVRVVQMLAAALDRARRRVVERRAR